MEGVTRNVRTYDHFCLTARALERVGDRWSLLVIRDLLTGPKRFTDLKDRLGGITPRRSASACSAPPSWPSSSPATSQPAGTSGSTAATTWPKATPTGGHSARTPRPR